MNPSERELRQKSLAVRFPFEQVLNDRVKLKYAPIEFQWNIQENPDKITEPLAFAQIMEKKPDMWGYRRQERWFRLQTTAQGDNCHRSIRSIS